VQPVAATTITTDTKGLDARDVRIPIADGTLPGFPREALKAADETAEIIVYPEPRTRSTRSNALPTGEGRRRMAGSASSSGLSATASPELAHLS
jgi:hypothetical protein